MKRIVISDIHIGSPNYKSKELVSFLKKAEYDQLILAGDIIDFIKIPAFSHRFAEILNALDFSKEIIYVVGNHDISFEGMIGSKVGSLSFVDKYEFVEGGRRFRIIHGHQFEKGLINFNFFMKIFSVFYDYLERRFDLDITNWYVNYKLKKRKLRRIWDILKWNDDVDVIIMGHCHHPEAVIWVDKNQEIKTYVNCGDWVSNQSWVSIIDGVVRLKTQND